MRSYQVSAFGVLDRYDTFFGAHKTDAGVDFEIDMDFASPPRCETFS
jgi:hypothetical protein